MLICIFGLWLNLSQIMYLLTQDGGCKIVYGYTDHLTAGPLINESCRDVALEINKITKDVEGRSQR